MPDALISESYRRLQATLHHDPAYGVASLGFAPIVAALVNEHGFSELLDYGCGKRRLMQALEGKVQRDVKLHLRPYGTGAEDPGGRQERALDPEACGLVAAPGHAAIRPAIVPEDRRRISRRRRPPEALA